MRICNLLNLNLVPYKESLTLQKRIVKEIQSGKTNDTLILLEHPNVFTIGRNGKASNLLAEEKQLKNIGAEVFNVDRGGDITYHGPGQLVCYPVLNLRNYKCDIKWYVLKLEDVIVKALKEFEITSCRDSKLIGVWVEGKKIASIGVHISKWITYHGFALNVNTNLDYFKYIVPCGLPGVEMTSISKILGRHIDMNEVKNIIVSKFYEIFECEIREFSPVQLYTN